MGTLRLFVSVRPSSAALDHLAGALRATGVESGEGVLGPLRPTAPDQRHVTLAFYGDVPEGAVADLARALEDEVVTRARAIAPGGITASLAGAGVFSGRTLWVGVRDEPRGAFPALAAAAARAGETSGVPVADPERPRFRAHLTVARLSARWSSQEHHRARRRGRAGGRDVDTRDPLAGPAAALAVYVGPAFPVEEIELVSSHLGAGAHGGPNHEVLARVPLVAGGRC